MKKGFTMSGVIITISSKLCYFEAMKQEGIFHRTQNGKKCAFTLAEVLITLGIIGIVAAMTMPILVGKYQKSVHINQMKKTYSVFSNAFLLAREDYGDPRYWDWGADTSRENLMRVVKTYILPYLSLDSKSEKKFNTIANDYWVRLKDGTTVVFDLDGCTNPDSCDPIQITAVYMTVSHKNKTSGYGWGDRDYSREDYMLVFNKNRQALTFFYWGDPTNRNSIRDHSLYGCNKNIAKNKRYNCAQLIFMDGWEIKEDYPW